VVPRVPWGGLHGAFGWLRASSGRSFGIPLNLFVGTILASIVYLAESWVALGCLVYLLDASWAILGDPCVFFVFGGYLFQYV